MSDDRLLEELGRLARERAAAERARLDERWDRLAAGALRAEEEAELRALAEASPEAREAYEAFRPLGADFEARMTERLAAELAAPAPAPEPSPAPPAAGHEPGRRSGRQPPWRGGASFQRWWAAAATATAAAVVFLIRIIPSPQPLPPYTAELQGGARTFRGEEVPASGLQLFGPGDRLVMLARPASNVSGQVEARAFLDRGEGPEPWTPGPRLEIAGGGVRLQGRVGQELKIPPGNWRIWLVVGRRGKLPEPGELRAALRAGRTGGDRWQAVSRELRIADHAPP